MATLLPEPEIMPGPRLPRLHRLGDLFDALEEDAARRHQACLEGKAMGPRTPFKELDREFGGSLPPGFHVLHGSPGAGKTAFCLQFASMCECPALYVTCEMAPLELLRRLIARVTKTPLGRLKGGSMPPDEVLGLASQTARAIPDLAILDATIGYPDADFVEKAALRVRGNHPYLLLVVDSLHAWADGATAESTEYEMLNAACGALQGIAARSGCAVLAIAERNRAGMTKGGLHAGAGTRKIEYGAESVIDLAVDETTITGPKGETSITLTLDKNRNGIKGTTIKLRFHGALQDFQKP